MSSRAVVIGAALAVALMLFGPALHTRSMTTYADPPGGACNVNGDWSGFNIGAPPGVVTLVITQNPPHQNFTWIAYAFGPPPAGVAIAEGNGVVLPDFSFHIEGHGIPNAAVQLKTVHATGMLAGCPTMATAATFTYDATYTNGSSSSGSGALAHCDVAIESCGGGGGSTSAGNVRLLQTGSILQR